MVPGILSLYIHRKGAMQSILLDQALSITVHTPMSWYTAYTFASPSSPFLRETISLQSAHLNCLYVPYSQILLHFNYFWSYLWKFLYKSLGMLISCMQHGIHWIKEHFVTDFAFTIIVLAVHVFIQDISFLLLYSQISHLK